jgi:oligoendopeptidase F
MRISLLFTFIAFFAGCSSSRTGDCLIKNEKDNKTDKKETKDMNVENAKLDKGKPSHVTVKSRDEIDDKYKWDPSVLFASIEQWDQEKEALVKLLADKKDGPAKFKGKLGKNAKYLKKVLDSINEIRLRLEKLHYYAARNSHVDMRDNTNRGREQVAKSLFTKFDTVVSYVEPELLALPKSKLQRFSKAKTLKDYTQYFVQLLRLRPHVLSTKEEKILSLAGDLGYSSYEAYSTFSNSDMEFPSIVNSKDEKIELSTAMYSKYRSSVIRKDRKQLFEAFWPVYKKYRNTFSQMISGQIKYYVFKAKARKYENALTAALYPKNIPNKYYLNLIKSINNNLDAFYDYLKLRKEMLEIKDDLRYYDIYPPLVKDKPKDISFADGKKIIREALKPLGKDYMAKLDEALKESSGWLYVYPIYGKRTGAYMAGVYGVHPFVLLNYNDDFDAVTTTAHELGHALHTVYSNKHQPYSKSDYVIFNAEVASIVNETLLIEYMLKKEKDIEKRKYLLSHYLNSFRGTVFRQTLFAEFEHEMYTAYENGKALTADFLDNLYLGLLRKYHGHKQGVMDIQELYAVEWSYIPHFYYNYYVYSYVNGFIAATVLAEKILNEGKQAADKYINGLLKAGSSKDPLQILKDAGVDMMSPATFKNAINKFRNRTKELRQLQAKSTK